MFYKTSNGIPIPEDKPLEQVDWRKIEAQRAADPFHQLLRQGHTQKEALIILLNKEN